MSTEAAGQDILSILRMFTSPRMGPFENTNAPAPQPPDASVANAKPPNLNSGNEQQSDAAPSAGPPQPVARKVVPEADAPVAGANEAKLTLPPPGNGAPGPGLAAQPPVAPGAGTMPGFVSNNVVWQAWEAQRQRLYAEAIERQKTDLMAAGIGDIAGAFGAKVGGYRGGGEGGGITQPGGSLATGSSALTMDQFSAFKKAQDDALADKQDMERIDRIVADPRMKGVSKDVLLTLKKNHPEHFTALLKDYFNGESDTFSDSDGNVWSRPKHGVAGALPTPIYVDQSKTQANRIDRTLKSQELIDPALQSDESLRSIAKTLNLPDDPATLATLRQTSAKELQERVTKVQTSAATGQGGPRGWVNKEIEFHAENRRKLNETKGQLPRLEYLVDQLDSPDFRGNTIVGDTLNNLYRQIGGLTGQDAALPMDKFNSGVELDVQKVVKTYGANASDGDRVAAGHSLGKGVTGEVARGQLALVAKGKIWEINAANREIDDRIKRGHLTAGEKEQYESHKVDLPEPTPQTLHVMGIEKEEVDALKAAKGQPNEAALRAAFRREHGGEMAEWALGETK